VANADWILTKNEIVQKTKWLLEDLQSRQQQFVRANASLLPAEVVAIMPKISKGENYKGLPYLVLDHPRFFGRGDHFSSRTMFWWGNFFSITLHLAGGYKRMYEERIGAGFASMRENSYFIGVSHDPWEHHFEASNYRPLTEMDQNDFIRNIGNRDFIKLAK